MVQDIKTYVERVKKAAEFIKSKITETPEVCIVLGSGLHGIAEIVENPIRIPYKEIPEFPVSTAPGHKGELILERFQENMWHL